MKAAALSFFQRFNRAKDGIAAAEFAIAAPLMFFGLVIMADLGIATNEHMKLDQAVRAGADFIMSDVTDESQLEQMVIAAATGAYNETPSQQEISQRPNVSVVMTCECPEAPGVPVPCSGTLCANLLPASMYYKLSASKTYDAMLWADIPLSADFTVQTR